MSIELTPELAPEFAVTVRGYDRAQVDEYIDWLREWLSNATVRMEGAEAESAQLVEQVRRLQMRVDDLEVETSGEPPRTIGALGERMTRILELAEEGATAVRADAQTEADQLVARARAEAEAVARGTQQRQAELDSRLANATERAQQIKQEAETRATESAAKIMREAETRARTLDTQAKERARELVEGAQLQRTAVLEQLAAEKTALDNHIAGLVAQRAAILAGLNQLQESLATTIVEVPKAEVPVPPPPPSLPAAPQTRPAQASPASPPPATVAQADPDVTAANEFGDAVDLREDTGQDAGEDRPSNGSREFAQAGAPRKNGAGRDRTVLFDREAVEDDDATDAPPPPSFRRAGSKPEGSQRAGE